MPQETNRTTAHKIWWAIFKYCGCYFLLLLVLTLFNVTDVYFLILPIVVALPAFVISGIALIIIKQENDRRKG